MIWDPAKFLSEKLIGAIIGFTLKLLFCNICIYLMLYGFMSLASGFATKPFTGTADELVMIIFSSIFFFIICSKGPALATSLLTGSPSLSGSQAISAVGGAVAGAAAGLGMAKAAGGALAGGAAKAAFSGGGAMAQAGAAAKAAGDLGGGLKEKAGAFMSSIGGSVKEASASKGSDMARSLLSRGGGGGGGASGGPGGLNRHSQLDTFASSRNADGTRRSLAEQIQSRKEAGTNLGADYMVKQEEKRNTKMAAKNDGNKGAKDGGAHV
jgi:type IV secretion system protein TrbL